MLHTLEVWLSSLHLTQAQCKQIGQFIGLWATFYFLWQQLICHKSSTLDNFCEDVKIYYFSGEIIFGQLYRHLVIAFWSHWLWYSWRRCCFRHNNDTGSNPVILLFKNLANRSQIYFIFKFMCFTIQWQIILANQMKSWRMCSIDVVPGSNCHH